MGRADDPSGRWRDDGGAPCSVCRPCGSRRRECADEPRSRVVPSRTHVGGPPDSNRDHMTITSGSTTETRTPGTTGLDRSGCGRSSR